MIRRIVFIFFFFFNDTATTEIYTLSLHDALPIYHWSRSCAPPLRLTPRGRNVLALVLRGLVSVWRAYVRSKATRSEEHTSELQSRLHLVCRLLLEKKKHTAEPSTVLQLYLFRSQH